MLNFFNIWVSLSAKGKNNRKKRTCNYTAMLKVLLVKQRNPDGMVRTTTQLFQGTPKLMLIINETQMQPKT